MTILITGAGGMLGRAFVKHLQKENEIIAIDNNEWAVAELEQEFPKITIHLKDFQKWRFDQDPCDLVIHCAAYKHVNLGENNVHTFIDNNVRKTAELFAEAYKNNADILFISSDKAVEPISAYGYTKALGELLAKEYNGHIARLGNILSSYGSVIPAWEKSIKENKPIKITDPNMTRYVIDVDKSVKEIWQGYEQKDKLIIPDCREVNIMDLLKEVFKKHNIKDHRIEYVGIRAGEKMSEKLRWDYEGS